MVATMFLLVLLGIMTAVVIRLSLMLTKQPITPLSAVPLGFTVAVLAYVMLPRILYPLSVVGVFGIQLGLLSAICGGLLGALGWWPRCPRRPRRLLSHPKQLGRVIWLLFCIGLTAQVVQFSYLMRSTSAGFLMLYTNYFYIIRGGGFLLSGWAWLWQLNGLVFPLCVLYIARYRCSWWAILIAISSFISVLSRGALYYIIFTLLVAWLLVIYTGQARHLFPKILFAGSIFGVVIFLFFATKQYLFFGDSGLVWEAIQIYIGGPLVALDQVLQRSSEGLGGLATFRQVAVVTGTMTYEIDAWIQTGPAGSVSNALTFFGAMYRDFGWMGILLVPGAFTLVGMLIYRWYTVARSLGATVAITTFTASMLLASFGPFPTFIIPYYLSAVVVCIELVISPIGWRPRRRMGTVQDVSHD